MARSTQHPEDNRRQRLTPEEQQARREARRERAQHKRHQRSAKASRRQMREAEVAMLDSAAALTRTATGRRLMRSDLNTVALHVDAPALWTFARAELTANGSPLTLGTLLRLLLTGALRWGTGGEKVAALAEALELAAAGDERVAPPMPTAARRRNKPDVLAAWTRSLGAGDVLDTTRLARCFKGLHVAPRLASGGPPLSEVLCGGLDGTLAARWSVWLPARALERLVELTALEVVSEAAKGADGRETVEERADPRPVVRLSRDGQGLLMQVGVRPLQEGPFVLAGEGARRFGELNGSVARVCERDFGEECRRRSDLLDVLPLALAEPLDARRWVMPTTDAALELLDDLSDAISVFDFTVEWPDGDALDVQRGTVATLRLKTERTMEDWFSVTGDLVFDDGEAIELERLLDARRGGERWIALSEDRFLKLTDALWDLLAPFDAALGAGGRVLPDPEAAEALVGAMKGELTLIEGGAADPLHELRERLHKACKVDDRPPPALSGELRAHQREGLKWLRRMAALGVGVCLADEMGVGKTLQAIALLADRADLGPQLVVCPTSVVDNWCRELARFAPGLTVVRHGPRDLQLRPGPGQVWVTSYALLALREELQQLRLATAVFDEAQAMKNPRTRRHRAADALSAKWSMALTGTPLENHLGELWAILHLVAPGVVGPWPAFKRRFDEEEAALGPGRARQHLADRLKPLVLRRTKADVDLGLEERSEVDHRVVLSRQERLLYERERLDALASIDALDPSIGGVKRLHALAHLTRLRLMACDATLVGERLDQPATKRTAVLALVEQLVAQGDAVLVFSQFVRHLSRVRSALFDAGIAHRYLDGQTPARARANEIDAFQRGEAPVFLLSLKAAGVGLNLTRANHVIHLDPWWNPAVMDQADARAHRLGQERAVTVHRFVAAGTVEDRVLALHDEKRALFASVLEGTASAGALTVDDLCALLRDDPLVEQEQVEVIDNRSLVPRAEAAPRLSLVKTPPVD